VEAALAAGADLASADGTFGNTALHLAAGRGHLEVVDLLLAKGADPLAHDAGTMTPLHVAARDGRTKVVRLLLARARCSSSVLRDVLFVASGSARGRPEVVALIEGALEDACRREAGVPPASASATADRDARAEKGATPDEELILAAERDDAAAVRRALERGAAPDAAGPGGVTPLMSACEAGNDEMARLLLARGADLGRRDARGNTPLLIACAAGHGRLAAHLIHAGAEAEVMNDDGYTALMGAARCDDKPLVELLLARGADPTHTYVGGNTAASIASRGLYGDASLVQLLRQAELLACLKARRRYLRHFAHAYGSPKGHQRFIFYDGARFVDAWWVSSKRRFARVRGWSEVELREQLAKGHYPEAVVGDFARGPIGDLSEIPAVVLTTAPPLAQRFLELVALLADGTRELELVRVKGSFLWCREGKWFWGRRELPVPYGRPDSLRPIAADFALELIEETLVKRPATEPILAEPARVERANTAIDRALAALRRLYGGEVWEEPLDATAMLTAEERTLAEGSPDVRRLRFGRAAKLYRGYQRAREPLTSVERVSELAVLGDLIEFRGRGFDPAIVPARPDHLLPAASEDRQA
jgi:ankyrin repeat protein